MNEEINVLDLLRRTAKTVKNNFRALIVIISICLVAALILKFSLKETYESRMIVKSDILTEPFINNISMSINELIKMGSLTSLKNKFDISSEEAQAVAEINIEGLGDEEQIISEVKSEKFAFFIITIKVHSTKIIPKLQNSIIQYIQNNEYVKIRVQHRKDFYTQSISKVDREIKALDSLKTRITQGHAFAGTGNNMVLLDPTEVYAKSIELFDRKIKLGQSLELANGIELIDGFGIPSRPVNSGVLIFLSFGFVAGLILFGFFILYKDVKSLDNDTHEN